MPLRGPSTEELFQCPEMNGVIMSKSACVTRQEHAAIGNTLPYPDGNHKSFLSLDYCKDCDMGKRNAKELSQDRTFKQRSKPWWQCRSDKKKQEWLAKAKNAGYETEQEMWHSLCKALPNRLIGKIWGVSGSCINHRAIKCGVPLKRGQKYRGPQTPVCPKCQTPLTPALDEKIIWLRQCGCSL